MKPAFRAFVAVAILATLSCAQAQQHVRPRPLPRPLPPLVDVRGAEQPVRLASAEVTVEASGSLARTTLLITLHNPNDRPLEGTLQFPLQPGQRVAGFALDIEGTMRDAVPVPKAQGRQVFESIERRNVDPALLEQVAGNHFRLRVYPIPARGTRQVRLVLDETMRRDGDAWRLDVPVHLLAGAGDFSLRVSAPDLASEPGVSGAFEALDFRRWSGGYVAEVERDDFRPATGLVLRFPVQATARAYATVVDGEHYVLAELPVRLPQPRPRDLPTSIGLLWDASGSAVHRDRASEYAVLDRYFAAMGNGNVTLRLLRDVGEDGGTFAIRDGDWQALRAALERAPLDGATNLADWTPAPGIGEYLLVSDGLGNYGDGAFPALLEGQRFYALSSAGARTDATRLAELAGARGGRLVSWQGTDALDDAVAALTTVGTRVASLDGDGVADLVAESPFVQDGLLRVAGRLVRPDGTIRARLETAGATQVVELPVGASASPSPQAATAWASWRVAALSADPDRNREAIARLGRAFSLVTPGTSLLVLDDPADYVRHDIPAPPALRERVAALRRQWRETRELSRGEQLDRVAAAFAERIAWWEHDFPKTLPPPAKRDDPRADALQAAEQAASARMVGEPAPTAAAAPMAPPTPVHPGATSLDRIQVTGSRIEDADAVAGPAPGDGITVRLQPWEPDSPYARRLRDAAPGEIYALYLDERDSHADSSAFYLDVADLLLERGRRDEALRVLSNLAEMDLENRHVLRVLGYRLAQADAWPLAVDVFRQVLDMAGEEPQSHRDLGLALAETGRRQEAIERLYEVVVREWDSRFAEIELVALNELNRIVATSPEPLDTAFVDRRLLRNLPLDLRVVLSWDSDNSDMDLWVTDPNGEKCYYANPRTYQGGLISDDFTGGYGPEEFLLRDAKPGTYRVEAHYFGDRQQVVTGATTLMLKLTTGWGTPRQQDHAVTLRLPERDATVLVGEFEVR